MSISNKTRREELREIGEMFRNSFGHLSAAELNQRPRPDAWSIAQVVAHIITTNESYYPTIDQLKAGTYKPGWPARFGFLVKIFGDSILKSVAPNRSQKIKTFPIWEPSRSAIDGDILDRFEAHQGKLAGIIESSKDLIDKNTVISSPANRNIVYTLDRAFDIMISHERRHYNQALEVLHQMQEGIQY